MVRSSLRHSALSIQVNPVRSDFLLFPLRQCRIDERNILLHAGMLDAEEVTLMSLLLTILLWILIGALAGWIASLIMGARRDFWWDVLIGIIGAFVGGTIFGLLGLPTGSFGWSLFAAIVGAVIVIALVRALWRRPATAP